MKLFKDPSFLNKPSVLLLLFCFCFSFITMDLWRSWHFEKHNFEWDVANYYSYLPATFLNEGSFDFGNYISTNFLGTAPNGEKLSRGTYGMAFLYSPFFALGYKLAFNAKEPLDGFSEGFATAIHWGSILYSLIGLILLRNLLVKSFSERTTTLTLIIVLFGTMLFYYTYGNSEMPHAYLFFLTTAFLLCSWHWHEKPGVRNSLLLALSFGFMVLIRPTEMLTGLIFLFWGVNSRGAMREQLRKFSAHWKLILLMGIVFTLIWIPQFLFWKARTGHYFYSPYAAVGEKFFWDDPQILNILFSYRKGWITYTPLILLAFAGFFFMKKTMAGLRWSVLALTLLNIYILSCWWDWFFGGCFGARGFCHHIAYLSLPIASISGYFADRTDSPFSLYPLVKLLFFAFVFLGVSLNVGMSYQYSRHMIHFNSMTKKSYWWVFGKYSLEGHDDEYWKKLKEPDYGKLRSGEERDQ